MEVRTKSAMLCKSLGLLPGLKVLVMPNAVSSEMYSVAMKNASVNMPTGYTNQSTKTK